MKKIKYTFKKNGGELTKIVNFCKKHGNTMGFGIRISSNSWWFVLNNLEFYADNKEIQQSLAKIILGYTPKVEGYGAFTTYGFKCIKGMEEAIKSETSFTVNLEYYGWKPITVDSLPFYIGQLTALLYKYRKNEEN